MYCKPFGKIPEPWELNEEWLQRLEIAPKNQRSYLILTPTERCMLEAQRRLFLEYGNRGLIESDKKLSAFIHQAAKWRDKSLLSKGNGRAVDFNRALDVLDKLAAYISWASGFHGQKSLLHDFLVYQIDGSVGFLEISVVLDNPMLGKLGEVSWNNVYITLTELESFNQARHGLGLDRVGFPVSYTRTVVFTKKEHTDAEPIGLLALFVECAKKVVDQTISWSNRGCFIDILKPQASQVQQILDVVAENYLSARYPLESKGVQFQVAGDLTKITVTN